MPAPTIPSIPTLNFTVGVRQSYSFPIGNNPTWVSGYSAWDTFVMTLSGNNLVISGTPTRVGSHTATVLISNADGEVQRDFTISVAEIVVPRPPVVRPVIVPRSTITLRAGTDYTANPIEITIRNKPSTVRVFGVPIGLNWRFSTNGIEIIGTAADVPVRGGSLLTSISIFASNSGGSHSASQPILYTR